MNFSESVSSNFMPIDRMRKMKLAKKDETNDPSFDLFHREYSLRRNHRAQPKYMYPTYCI